jgi:hypothetical protein
MDTMVYLVSLNTALTDTHGYYGISRKSKYNID